MKFYSVQIRESVEVPDSDVEVVTMKNGKMAAKAKTMHNGKELKLFKILSKEDAARLGK
jgi:hypothetical protein